MRPEEIRSHGVALAERMRTQVKTSDRLEMMLQTHRRRRTWALAAATAAALIIAVGILMLSRVDQRPVITVPPTTVPSTEAALRLLPVEVFMILEGAYTVDEATGTCEGSGPLAGIGEGSAVHVFDQSVFDSADDAPTITLPAGLEITEEDPRSSFLLSRDESAACMFVLPDLGYEISDYENITLFPESDPNVSSGMSLSGQRVVFSFSDSP
jgi:hypothetical protein